MTLALTALEVNKQHDDAERMLWAILSLTGRPDGFIDIGARDGWLVRTAYYAGIRPSIGIETDPEHCAMSATRMFCRDIDKPFIFQGNFELVTCLYGFNVSKAPDVLAQNLIRLTSKYLVCGQGWPVLMTESRRLMLDEDLTERMESALQRSLGVFQRII